MRLHILEIYETVLIKIIWCFFFVDFVDGSYVDPLGPLAERPKTAAKRRDDIDEFADEELGEDMLPE